MTHPAIQQIGNYAPEFGERAIAAVAFLLTLNLLLLRFLQ